MKKSIVVLAISFIFQISESACAQTPTETKPKLPVFGEVGFGVGQTLFFGDIKDILVESYGGSFNPGRGTNLMFGFYVSPQNWKGFGIGSRVKGTFGAPVKGDFGNDYIFNYYNIAFSLKYYLLTREFNKGLYVRGGFGFGQLTTKRVNEAIKLYKHQYALGNTLTFSVGYSIPIKKTALSFEAEFELSNRRGTVDGKGDSPYQSGQIGGSIIFSF